tara:strand:- start:1374 stop:1556 length:183 start_codon:yes stop_codon:yes gene_type:complete
MERLKIYKQVPQKYILIPYDEVALPGRKYEEVYLTEHEASIKNRAFAFNNVPKRYVKANN